MRSTLEDLYNKTHNGTAPTFPLSIACVEPRGCILVALSDEDVVLTTPTHSPTSGGGDDDDDDDNTALAVGITAGVLLAIGFIILLAVLLYECSANGSYMDSTALATASLQASMTMNAQRQQTSAIGNNYGRYRR